MDSGDTRTRRTAQSGVPSITPLTPMRRAAIKRSVSIAGRETSINIEQPFWDRLAWLAKMRATSINALVAEIAREKEHRHLSNAVRLAVFEDAVQRSAAQDESFPQ